MSKLFIIIFSKPIYSGMKETEFQTASSETLVLDKIQHMTSDGEITLDRVFSVDEYGRETTHYDVVFKGRLKLEVQPREGK